MLYSITGRIVERGDNRIALSLSGGMVCECAVSSLAAAQWDDAHDNVTIYTQLFIKDDRPELYGFHSVLERDLFLQLIRVGGIGPRGAIGILSQMEAGELRQAIVDGDYERIALLKRVGLKNAQKIVLTVRGAVKSLAESDDDTHDELIDALIGMGYDRRTILRIVPELRQKHSPDEFATSKEYEEHVFKAAIDALSH